MGAPPAGAQEPTSSSFGAPVSMMGVPPLNELHGLGALSDHDGPTQ